MNYEKTVMNLKKPLKTHLQNMGHLPSINVVSLETKPFQRYIPFFEEQYFRNYVSMEVRGSFTFLRDHFFGMDSDQTKNNLTKPSETHLINEPFYLSHGQFPKKLKYMRDITFSLKKIFS
jgi:hypothetical protein